MPSNISDRMQISDCLNNAIICRFPSAVRCACVGGFHGRFCEYNSTQIEPLDVASGSEVLGGSLAVVAVGLVVMLQLMIKL